MVNVQTVRLLDVFVVAPFLFYVGSNKSLSSEVRIGLNVLAAATLIYNGVRYMQEAKKK